MKVGDIEILPVLDGTIVSRLPASMPFPDQQSETWREQHMFRPDGRIESTVGAYLVRAGERVILCDAGAGQALPGGYSPPNVDLDDDDDPFVVLFSAMGVPRERLAGVADHFRETEMERGQLPASLRALGVEPAEVTDVVCSHLHFDHIGWVTVEGAPWFPNATIRCAAADLEHFLADPQEEHVTSLVYQTPDAKERLAPVLDRVETWESDQTLFPGVDVRLAPGHTPGSSVVVLSDGSARAMLLGDMVHCPLELTTSEFNLLVDIDPEAAARVREAYARELEESAVPASAAHLPGLRFGRVLPGEGRRRWVFDAA